MFTLILAILLSSLSQLAQSTPGLYDTLSVPARPTTFENIYSDPYYPFSNREQPPYPFMIKPPPLNRYFDETSYSPMVYIPGQINPYIKYHNFEPSIQIEEYPSTSFLRSSRSPQTVFYESLQSATNPDFPHYSVRNYHHLPFPAVDSIPKKTSNYSQVMSDKVTNVTNVNTNRTSDIDNEEKGKLHDESVISGINNNTASNDQNVQLTYLGFSPMTSWSRTPDQTFRSIMPSEFGIPFYPIDGDRRAHVNEEKNPEPILVSPQRLVSEPTPSSTSFRNVYPLSDHSAYPLSENQYIYAQAPPRFTSQPQYSSPYRSQPWLQQSYFPPSSNPNQHFYPDPRSENGYYLIDVKPESTPSYKQPNPTTYISADDPMLGLIKPIILPRPILPTQRTLQSGVSTNTGVTNSGQMFNKYQHQNYNTGFETNLPSRHVYSNLHTDRGIEMQNYDRKGEHSFNTGSGLNLRPFGVPGLTPPQLKPVLKPCLDCNGLPKAKPVPILTPGKLIKVTYNLNYTLTKFIRLR